MGAPVVKIYSTPWCGYCRAAESLLRRRGIDFERVEVSGDTATRAWLVEVTGQRTVPQIFIGERSIGGFDELSALDHSGELDTLLDESG